MNLADDFNELTTSRLLELGYIPKASHDAFFRFNLLFTYVERMVVPAQYRVEMSDELRNNPRLHANKIVINEIVERLKTGKEVVPYLSKSAKLEGGRDDLLAFWGIHHLHLSGISTSDSRGKVAPADELLFVRFYKGIAHLIQIENHRKATQEKFANIELLEIADRNWPHLHDVINRVTGAKYDPATLKQLRAGNLNHYVTVNGRVLAPTYGVMANGSSAEALWHFDSLNTQLARLDLHVRANFAEYFRGLRTWIANVRLVGFDEAGFDLAEKISGKRARALKLV